MEPPIWETERRDEYRACFGEDLDAYDRTRPVAPDAVFDALVELARLTAGSLVLEIGPGTGQATVPMLRRGLRVTAVEVDPRLAARTRRNLAGFEVVVEASSFEEWDPAGRSFDAVVACNSFHWLDPATRYPKVASVLAPGGHLAVLTTPVVVPDGADRFWWDVQDDWVAVGARRLDPATLHPDLVADPAEGVRESGLFDEPATVRRPFDLVRTADEHARNLSTQSGVKQLEPRARAELVERVRRRVERAGGSLTVHHLAVLTVAGRRSGTSSASSSV